jgi:hypothetical protein
MRKYLIAFIVGTLMSISAIGQEHPRVHVFGGYSYMNSPQDFSLADRGYLADSTYRGSASGGTGQNGWNASLSFDIKSNVELVADVGGHYQFGHRDVAFDWGKVRQLNHLKTQVSSIDHSFLFGPRIHFLERKRIDPFSHVLLGISTISRKQTGTVSLYPNAANPFTENLYSSAFAFAIGGGVDWRYSRSISIRLFQADYIRSKHFFKYDQSLIADPWTNDRIANRFRISTGLVLNIGKK